MNSQLSLSDYTFTLTLQKSGRLPAFKGSFWHGIIGSRLKELYCISPTQDCSNCEWRTRCRYLQIFEPFAPEVDRFSPSSRPKAFVIRGLDDYRKQYRAGDQISFDITLLGDLQYELPIIVSSLGSGLRVGQEQLPTELAMVKQRNLATGEEEVIGENGKLLRMPLSPYPLASFWQLSSFPPSAQEQIQLRFLTPTRLKTKGHYNGNPTFAQIIGALIRKINQLEVNYGSGERGISAELTHEWIAKAEGVQVESSLTWIDWKRYSRRSDETMALGGFTGTLLLHGDLRPFLPMLQAGVYLNVGKQASFGLGQYRIE